MSQAHEMEVKIGNQRGLHLRAAVQFVRVASQYQSDIQVVVGAQKANGKSIMALAALAASKGVSAVISATGHDAQAALEDLRQLVVSNFGEE